MQSKYFILPTRYTFFELKMSATESPDNLSKNSKHTAATIIVNDDDDEDNVVESSIEPILMATNSRFVLFPIRYEAVWKM